MNADSEIIAAPLRLVRLASILEADAAEWDSLNSDGDLFHSHRFIRAVEAAEVERSQFWYLLFYRGDRLEATAALSAFTVSLDLFVGGGAGRFIRGVRRWQPSFLKIRILFCGLPVSLGQRNLVIRDPAQAGEVLGLLAREMAAIAQAEGLRYLCVKEFLESQLETVSPLTGHGYFLAHSIPYVTMVVRWPTFEAYLANLRHGYRRPIRLALRKFGQAAPAIGAARQAGTPRLVLGGPEICPTPKLFELYMQVMDRAEVKLEVLNQPFFEQFYAHLKDDLEVLAVMVDDEVLGAALITTVNGTLTFVLVGLDYARRDEHDVYFNLVYGILQLAIQRGCRRLDLGQTSYWLKQRVGGVCIPEYFYFKSTRPGLHFLLHRLRSLVFPELKVPHPRAFKTTAEEPNDRRPPTADHRKSAVGGPPSAVPEA